MNRNKLAQTAVAALFLILFLFLPKAIFAGNESVVLGDATTSAAPQISATAEGPGLILPDSPLFFLDQIKQNVRLFFAFTPEAKAKTHAAIAGERLAELRIMLARNNQKGIITDLNGISENLTAAADELSQAQLTGRNISQLAQTINADIRRDQDAIDSLSSQETGNVKIEVNATQDVIFRAKLKAEDSLPVDLIQNEVLDDLTRRATQQVRDASDSAIAIGNILDALNQEALKVASSSSAARQALIQQAISQKNIEMQKIQEHLLLLDQQRQLQLIQAQKNAILQAQTAVQQAQKAAAAFQQAENVINQLRLQSASQSAK